VVYVEILVCRAEFIVGDVFGVRLYPNFGLMFLFPRMRVRFCMGLFRGGAFTNVFMELIALYIAEC
jgi:hypothetical protein